MAFFEVGEGGLNLPVFKGSTFRGMFGHIFKNLACTCPNLDGTHFEHLPNCIYGNIFESTNNNGKRVYLHQETIPRPFLFEVTSEQQKYYFPGDRISFCFTLFGDSIKYLPYFVNVLDQMGKEGFGNRKQKAFLREIYTVNTEGDFDKRIFLISENIIKSDFSIFDFKEIITDKKTNKAIIYFKSPTRLKNNGHYTDLPEFHVVFRSAVRRITSLLYYYHNHQQLDIDFKELFKKAEEVKLVESDVTWYDWERYSNRQKERMKLGGIVGKATYEGDLEPFIPWLQLAEWTHIGKNTTFGLGKIKVVFE